MAQNDSYKTEQEAFWAGDFGNSYIERNRGGSRTPLFARILSCTQSVQSVIEFGSNIGLNLEAIRRLLPEVEIAAIEINKRAIEELNRLRGIQIYPMSILDFKPDRTWDFVFTSGVLIHMNPNVLADVYNLIYTASSHYICIVEYYNPTPVEVTYRGHKERLFKRDFAGEILDRFDDLHLIDYGFLYHRDNHFQDGDSTWFLLEKT